MKQARSLYVVLALVLASSLSACTRVGPGYVGIKVSMAGDNKGVDTTPAVTGWTFYNPMFSSVLEYPTFVRTVAWTKSINEGNAVDESITFTNSDQMQIAANISLSYHLIPEKVPAFYVKFRSDDLDTFTHGILRNMARDQFNEHGGKYTIAQIMGDNAAFIKDVRDGLQKELTPIGVQLDQFGFINAPIPPQAVIEAINGKVHATQLAQQKQNELVQAQADAAKEVAKTEGYAKSVTIRTDAEASANRKIAESLTPTLVEYLKVQRWNGVMPTVVSGSSSMIMSLPTK